MDRFHETRFPLPGVRHLPISGYPPLSPRKGQTKHQRWWIAYTQDGQEEPLARWLLKRGVGVYLALVPGIGRANIQSNEPWRPLIPRHLFLRADEHQLRSTATSEAVIGIRPVDDQHQLCVDLLQLNALLHTDACLTVDNTPETRRLPFLPGRRVMINCLQLSITARPLPGNN